MNLTRSIGLLVASLALIVFVYATEQMFGTSPLVTAGYALSGAALVGSAAYLIWLGYERWHEARETLAESERAFLEDVELEIEGGERNGERSQAAGTPTSAAEPDTAPPPTKKSVLADSEPATGRADAGTQMSFRDQPLPTLDGAGDLADLTRAVESTAQLSESATDSIESNAQPTAPSSPLAPESPASPPAYGQPAMSSALRKLADDLKRLGVITTYEGKVDLLPPAPPAPIYQLRAGGHALLLEDLESHRFLAHQVKRFRAIIIRGPAGDPIVLRRYQDFVSDELDNPTQGTRQN